MAGGGQMKKIYVAGKYDDDNVISVLTNIKIGIELSVEILRGGDIPFCPFLDFLFVLSGNGHGLTSKNFRDYSMEWLRCCDEIWLLPSWKNSGRIIIYEKWTYLYRICY